MKRILVLLTAFMLLSVQGFSQFGIKGGLNYTSLGDLSLDGDKNFTTVLNQKKGFHLGILYKVKFPLTGLALQPELIYSNIKGGYSFNAPDASSSTSKAIEESMNISYIQLPVGLQWGVDLMLFRPYLQVVPYVGYCIGHKNINKMLEWDMNKFRYGIGLGAGLDIWKLQISGRYSWDFGTVADFEWQGAKTFKGGKNKGFELSLAILF